MDSLKENENLLIAEDLCLNFGGLMATNHVSMHVKAGSITALIGPNGAGKTTLFNQFTGVYKPDSGRIWFQGRRIDGLKPYQICESGISRTYQVINLFNRMSVEDNVMVGMHTLIESGVFPSILKTNKKTKEDITARSKAFELMEFAGIEESANQMAGELPYGKQRLLEIIRGMASNPKLLLLDEPAAGMNSAEKERLNSLIRRIVGRGISVLIVEHDMKLIMDIADEIFVIESGKNLANGTPFEIQNNEEVIRAYLGGED